MVQTRSQDRGARARTHSPTPHSGSKRKASDEIPPDDNAPRKHRRKSETDAKHGKQGPGKGFKALLERVLSEYGEPPLKDLVEDDWPASKVVMTHILYAMLSSARISHDIARSTLECLVKHNYHDLKTLKESSWEERTEILSEGGYVRYRERLSNFMGDLIELMGNKYDNDASKLLPNGKRGDEARATLSKRLHDIKGLGPVGIDIVLSSIQGYFPAVVPFLDARSRKTAAQIGLGNDVNAMYFALGSDPARMAELEVGLTKIRFEKKEGDFQKSS